LLIVFSSIDELLLETVNALKVIFSEVESKHKTYQDEMLTQNSTLEAKLDNPQSLFESLEHE
jgi:hypothetical protein